MKLLIRTIIEICWTGTKHLSSHRFLFLIICLVVVFGLLGFQRVFPEFGFFTHLFMVLQLFLLDPQSFDSSDAVVARGETIPITLDLARWLAAFVTFYGVAQVVLKLMRGSSDKFKIQRMRRHGVIFESGHLAEEILEQVLQKRQDYVLMTRSSQSLAVWRKAGLVGFEIGEGVKIDTEHLKLAGLERASSFEILGEDGSENLRAAIMACSMATGCRMFLRQDDPYFCDLLQRNHPMISAFQKNTLRVVSVNMYRARMLLLSSPLEILQNGIYATEVHLVVLRLNSLQRAVILQAALVGHYRDGIRVKLWLDSEASREKILADHPKIMNCLDIEVASVTCSYSIASIGALCKKGSLVTILADHLAPELALIEVLKLKELWPSGVQFRFIIDHPSEIGLNTIVLDGLLVALPSIRDSFSSQLFADSDKVAKEIHMFWHKCNEQRIQVAMEQKNERLADDLRSKATFKKWEDLTEAQKDANRSAADHILIKLRAVGLHSSDVDLKEAWTNLDRHQIVRLARMEHERWAAFLWLANYKPGVRNDVLRQNPNLVPFDHLDQSAQEDTIEQTRMTAEYFLSAS
jgi:hypothetical protein